MSVLVEGISVIVKISSIERVMDWAEFFLLVPNETLCSDGEIARVGFLDPNSVRAFVEQLQLEGLVFQEGGVAKDITVADQQHGFTTLTPWAEIGKYEIYGQEVTAAQLRGSQITQLVHPEDWEYEGSLSQHFTFIPNARDSSHYS